VPDDDNLVFHDFDRMFHLDIDEVSDVIDSGIETFESGEANRAMTFSEPGGATFTVTGDLMVENVNGHGSESSNWWLGTGRGEGSSSGVIGAITVERGTVFEVKDFDAWTARSDGSNHQPGDMIFRGTLADGTVIEETVAINPPDDTTYHSRVNFNDTALDGALLTSLEIEIPDGSLIDYFALDNFNYFSIVESGPLSATGISLVGDDLVIEDTDGSIANQFVISSDGTNLTITDSSGEDIGADGIAGATGNGTDSVMIPLSSFVGAIIINGAGGDDTVEIDYSSGADFAGRAITFNGQGQDSSNPGDQLILTGGSFDTAEYNYTNASDGTIQLSGQGLITYTGLEPIINTGDAVNVILNLPAIADAATLTDNGATITLDSGGTFETTTFAKPIGSLTINGDTNDSVTFTNPFSMSADLALTAGSITLANNVTTAGNDQTYNGAVTLGSDVNLSAGNVSLNGTVALGANDLTLTVTGTAGTTSGSFSGTGEIIKEGNGTHTITAISNSTGGVSVNGGTLALNAAGVATNRGVFAGAQSITVNSGATLEVAGVWNVGSANLLSALGGTINISAFMANDGANYINNLALDGGLVSGNPFRTGDTTDATFTVIGAAPSTISAEILLVDDVDGAGAGSRELTIDVAAASQLNLTGSIRDLGQNGTAPSRSGMDIDKTGGGVVTITAISHSVGDVTVNGGTLELNATGVAFDRGVFAGTRAITVNPGATLELGGVWNVGSANLLSVLGGTLNISSFMAFDGANYINNLSLDGGLVSGNPFRTGNSSDGAITVTGVTPSTISSHILLVDDVDGAGAGVRELTLDVAAVSQLNLTGSIRDLGQGGSNPPLSGMDIAKTGDGIVVSAGTNTYIGDTNISSGSFQIDGTHTGGGTYTINANGTLTGGGTVTANIDGDAGSTIVTAGNLTLGDTSDTAGFDTLGNVIVNSGDTLTVRDQNVAVMGNSTVVDGILTKGGGTQGFSMSSGDTLSGTGTVNGDITSNTGAVAPGNSPGIITVNGNVDISNGYFEVENDGTAGAGVNPNGHDQLVVYGTVDVTGADLDTTGSGIVAAAVGNVFTIIDNDMADAVTGTFTGFGEGATVTVNGQDFKIFYSAGDGNDVVLAAAPVVNTVYVDDSFTQNGGQVITDADLGTAGNQGAVFGVNAFTSIADAIATVSVGGTIIVNAGTYSDNLVITNGAVLDVTGPALQQTATITGQISGVGALTKNGLGTLILGAANSYDGVTTVNDGVLQIASAFALGASGSVANGTIVQNGGALDLNGFHQATERIEINGPGDGTADRGALYNSATSMVDNGVRFLSLGSDASVGNDGGRFGLNSGTVSGAFTLTKVGNNEIWLSSTVTVANIIIEDGAYGIQGDNADNISGAITVNANGTLATWTTRNLDADIVMNSGLFDTRSTGAAHTVTLNGDITLNGLNNRFDILGTVPTTINGVISGGGQLIKTDAGTLILDGNNTYTGTTAVQAGELQLDGDHTGAGAYTISNGTTLSGEGATTGSLTVNAGGTITPGTDPASPSTDQFGTGALTLQANSEFDVDINGITVGTHHDQLDVTGNVDITDALLNLTLGGGFVPTADQSFTIIDNDLADAVTGFFRNPITGTSMPEGHAIDLGSFVVTISYVGGDGNDVVLNVAGSAETEVELDGTTLEINDINGGISNDDLRISVDTVNGRLIIEDPNNPITTSIPGAIRPSAFRVEILLTSFTDVDIQTLTGDDQITIDGLTGITGSVAIDGGDDFDEIIYNAATPLGSLTGASTYTASAERITHTAGSTLSTDSGSITLIGIGGGAASFNGVLLEGATVQSTSGPIAITGQGGDSGFYNGGVRIGFDRATSTGSSVASGGQITLTGTGGSAGGQAQGVIIDRSSVDATGLTGGIDIDGTAGAAGGYNYGAYLFDAELSTNGGDITIDGTGSGLATTSANTGVTVYTDSNLSAGGSGELNITGTGGNGLSNNDGIYIHQQVNLTVDDGDMTLTGTAGGTGSLNEGINIQDGTPVTTLRSIGDGNIALTGTGSGSGTGNIGISLGKTVIDATADGTIRLDGTGSANGLNYNQGLKLNGTQITTAGGVIDLDGAGGSNATGLYNTGIQILNGSRVEVSTGNGAITIDGSGGDGTQLNEGVWISGTATIVRTVNGSIDITGSGGGSTAANRGLRIDQATVSSTGNATSDIAIRGTGSATSSGAGNVGVVLTNAEVISNNGDIDIEGLGGSGTNGNYGSHLYNTTITTGNGDLDLDGTAHAGTSGSSNTGIYLQSSALSAGLFVDVTGIGGGGTMLNQGIRMIGGSVQSVSDQARFTGQARATTTSSYNSGTHIQGANISSAADLTITGTGGSGTSLNYGVYLLATTAQSSGSTTTVTGAAHADTSGVLNVGTYLQSSTLSGSVMTVSGTGGGGTTLNQGVRMLSGSIQANNGAASIIGQARATTSGTYNGGVHLQSGSVGGSNGLTITGTGGTGSSLNHGVYLLAMTASGNAGATQLTGTAHSSTSGMLNTGVYLQSSQTSGTTLDVLGTGGGGTTLNQGIRLNGGSAQATGGNASFTGQARSTTSGTSNSGVHMQGAAIGSTGTTTVTGTGGGGTGLNHGIYMQAITPTGIFTTTGSTTDGNANSEDETGNFFPS